MEDILIIDATERFLKGEMTAQEKTWFEELRKSNPEIDQLVVEHTFFLSKLDEHGKLKDFKHSLNETEVKLAEEGILKPAALTGRAKVISLWKRYRRVVAVAASIAGMVSLLTVGVTSFFNNKANKNLQDLLGAKIDKNQKDNNNKIKELENKIGKTEPGSIAKSGGTGFLINGSGYMVTNAHVVKSDKIVVTNSKGREFFAVKCAVDNSRDIAILKIEDKDFTPLKSLPYSFSKTVNLASHVYTMGYPKDEVVYSEGYLSSLTGYKSDTLSYQISIPVAHGNSGGPVVNKNGDVIGVLTSEINGSAVFAIKTQYIFGAVETLSQTKEFKNVKLNTTNSIRQYSREDHVKRINDCVYLVKSY